MSSELNFKLHVIKIEQRQEKDQGIFIGAIKVKDFFSRPNEKFLIDYYKRNNGSEEGYQRSLSDSAVNKIKEYILKETKYPILPTGMLFSSRYKLDFKKEVGSFGTLEINNPLYVIDGQHRFEAWKSMMSDPNLRNELGEYEVPVVILSNYSKIKEIEQFFVINSRQKRIKTDLAQRNFLSLAGDKSTSGIIPERYKWNLYATKMVDVLNEQREDSIWNNKIILPNDGSDFRKIKVISQSSFISSLQPFFVGKDAIFNPNKDEGPIPVDRWADFINDYWIMISKLYPEIIDHPHDYSLMKTVGVFSLHLLLAKVIDQEGQGQKILDKHAQINILNKCQKYLDRAKGKMLKTEFWRSNVPKIKKASGNYAGAYSSAVGHSRIVSYILLEA